MGPGIGGDGGGSGEGPVNVLSRSGKASSG